MAYCKKCGNSIKDGDKTCRNCGAAIETWEEVEGSRVESEADIAAKNGLRFRLCDTETAENTSRLFDRRIMLCMFLMSALYILAFFLRAVDVPKLSVRQAVEGGSVALAMIVLLCGCVAKRRPIIISGLIAIGVAMIACMTAAAICFPTDTVEDGIFAASQIILETSIAAIACLIAYEMLTGRRMLGVHCVLVVIVSITLLAHIMLALVVGADLATDFSVIAYQVVSVFAKILLLTTMLILFSNLSHISVNESY